MAAVTRPSLTWFYCAALPFTNEHGVTTYIILPFLYTTPLSNN
jgi:hypothetical protein